jgi:hypothetical protein
LMDNSKNEKAPLKRKSTLVRQPLTTIGGIIAEAAKIYRLARKDRMDHEKARSLVWMLAQLRTMVETQTLERLEKRLEELAPEVEARHGDTHADRQTRLPH